MTKKLCDEMGLCCDLDSTLPPITLGTMLWFRPEALKKLLAHGWKYEDFQDEPLPKDGTVSHAIERVFAYVAQDAGYDTGTIMSDAYAVKEEILLREASEKVFVLLEETRGIKCYDMLFRYWQMVGDLAAFCGQYDRIYLYGAGEICRVCLRMLDAASVAPAGIFISDKNSAAQTIEGIPIMPFEECDYDENTGIIISVGANLTEEIVEILEKRKMYHYISYAEIRNRYAG